MDRSALESLLLTDAATLTPEFVERRLRGPSPLTRADRKLMSIAPAAYKNAQTAAKELSKTVGFWVWPMQIVALIVDRALGDRRSAHESR